MGDALAVRCEWCGEPMVPNVSTLDDDGCGWTCLTPECPEFSASELEAADLEEAGVPSGLARRLARLVEHCLDLRSASSAGRVDGVTVLDEMRANLTDSRRLATKASHIARQASEALPVPLPSNRSEASQQAKTDLAIASVLSLLAARSAHEAQVAIAGIDAELPGLASDV